MSAEADQRPRIGIDPRDSVILAIDNGPHNRAPLFTLSPNPRRDLKDTARFGPLKQQRDHSIIGVEVPAKLVAFLGNVTQTCQDGIGASMVRRLTEQPADKGRQAVAFVEATQQGVGTETIVRHRGVALNEAFRQFVGAVLVLAFSSGQRAIMMSGLWQKCFELGHHGPECLRTNEAWRQECAPLRKLMASPFDEILKVGIAGIQDGVTIQIDDRPDG